MGLVIGMGGRGLQPSAPHDSPGRSMSPMRISDPLRTDRKTWDEQFQG